MSKMDIREILKRHRLWLDDTDQGERADIRGADIRGADIRGANLEGAYLEGADIRGADIRGANLRFADIKGADIRGADIRGADIRGANLIGADLTGTRFSFDYKADPSLKGKVLKAVQAEGCALKMDQWHSCETSHCIAGWAVTLHPEGKELESKSTTYLAGRLLLGLDHNESRIFFTDDAKAMEWLTR